MAYITKEEVQEKRKQMQAVSKKYKLKITLSGASSCALTIKIQSGSLDFIGNYNSLAFREYPSDGYIQVNNHYPQDYFDGECLDAIKEILQVANQGNHDNSDTMTDYFDVGWYLHLSVGNWNKHYQLIK